MNRKIKWMLSALLSGVLLSGCALDLGQNARFGNYGGKQPEAKAEPPFDIMAVKGETRWFPAHIRWAPDDSHLLVSLCHTTRKDYCRIGKYWIAEQRWELLELAPQTTYRWPSYSHDGKWIAATVGECDRNYRCPGSKYTLTVLSADGKQTEPLINSYAERPSFSHDGKRLIYMRYTGGGAGDVAMFDLVTRKEEKLTEVSFDASGISGGAYFLPGDQRFVFGALLPDVLFGSTYKVVDGKVLTEYTIDRQGTKSFTRPLAGTKLDQEGPNKNVLRFVADRRQGVITRSNLEKLDLLWPDNGASANNAGAKHVNRHGDVLYHCAVVTCMKQLFSDGRYRISGVDPTILSATPWRQKRHGLALRAAREDANELNLFVINATAQEAAVSSDGLRVAFSFGWDSWDKAGIVRLGNPDPDFIEWPRLMLDPAATLPATLEKERKRHVQQPAYSFRQLVRPRLCRWNQRFESREIC
mgnify:CR=1 FL=1